VTQETTALAWLPTDGSWRECNTANDFPGLVTGLTGLWMTGQAEFRGAPHRFWRLTAKTNP
jgi:hypothetical protein